MSAGALRLVGGALLVLAGALLGREKLAEMRRRRACLRTLAGALGRLAGALEALESPLGELFSRLTDCPFFACVAAGFGSEPLERLWRRACETQPIGPEERAALASLGAVLGRCDTPRQCAEIALVRQSLSDAADALDGEIAARGRRFPALFAALGAILAVVLF